MIVNPVEWKYVLVITEEKLTLFCFFKLVKILWNPM